MKFSTILISCGSAAISFDNNVFRLFGKTIVEWLLSAAFYAAPLAVPFSSVLVLFVELHADSVPRLKIKVIKIENVLVVCFIDRLFFFTSKMQTIRF